MPLYLKTVCRPGRNVIQITGETGYWVSFQLIPKVTTLVTLGTLRYLLD